MFRPGTSNVVDRSSEAVIRGPGWAVQRIGPWVLGHWNESLNENRVIVCRDLYRAALAAHGHLQVLAVFRGLPFELDLLLAGRTRRLVGSLLEEVAPRTNALILPLEGTGMKSAIMRSSAAAVVLSLRSKLPISFPANLEEGLAIARSKDLFTSGFPESMVRERMAELESQAHWG